VKPNVGHSESASGVTSIIKSVLSLEKRTIIPNIKFETPNPKIPFATAKLTVPVDPKPWPADRSERISVNSFGIGGANAHVILDSAASFGLGSKTSKGTVENPSLFPRLLVFSANHRDSLAKVASNHEQYLESHPSSALNLAYTLGHRRDHLQLRSFCITDGDTPFEISPVAKSKSGLGIVFVFTGQGAQWPEMGRDLINDYPSFQADIQAMDKALSALDHPPSWSIEGI
ncbi:beta-ketoacyl synthase domain-containing protein, partial [Phlyctema vagabunda]